MVLHYLALILSRFRLGEASLQLEFLQYSEVILRKFGLANILRQFKRFKGGPFKTKLVKAFVGTMMECLRILTQVQAIMRILELVQ